MLRSILLLFISGIIPVAAIAKSDEDKIISAINRGDWFAVDSLYRLAPHDTLTPYVDALSRFTTGNRFNRPNISLSAFTELMNNHSDDLGLSQRVTFTRLISVDLSRLGRNEEAIKLLTDLLTDNAENLLPETVARLQKDIDHYTSLIPYSSSTVSIAGDCGRIPFSIRPVGNPIHQTVLMHLEDSYINGVEADITFDTGATKCLISTAMAEKYNFPLLPDEVKIDGIGATNGRLTIADSLQLGNITLRNVPFYIMDLNYGIAEADSLMHNFNIIIGSEIMLQLKDITIDFENNEITVPAVAPQPTPTLPNLVFSSSMNLLGKGSIHGDELLMNIDTGDATFGSIGCDFYKKNKKYIRSHATLDSTRRASIGGVVIEKCYFVPDMTLNLGGNEVKLHEIEVLTENSLFGYECNLGLKSLMLYKKVRFNLVDFTLTTE